MILDGSRADALRTLPVPTLVIHGLDDTAIDPSGGRRTAELVPGARLVLLDDMGHDRPPALWPSIVDAIYQHTQGGTRT
jgi:pimeloyl-ACP methyl ester carboxylesterase